MRVAISPQERAASAERVMSRLFDVPALQTARTVLSFSSFGSEVPTEWIARRLHDEGRRVLLPFVEGHDIEAAEAPASDSLVATDYGPMEPTERVAVRPTEVDVVLVPGLAFDRLGYRVGYGGGHYDRYLVRMMEMRQSLRIVEQAVGKIPEGPIMAKVPKVIKPPVGEIYHSIEAPKGELGYFIVSDGSTQPYRVRVRPPSFVNLQALEKMVQGQLVADVVAVIGTLDIVLGEVDR